MFNMNGHKIEITGLRGPSPRDEQVLREAEVDISDLAMVNKLFQDYQRKRKASDHSLLPEDVSMVVWAEDLARVPLIVFSQSGERLCWDDSVPIGCLEQYEQAARLINLGMMTEQQLAQEAGMGR